MVYNVIDDFVARLHNCYTFVVAGHIPANKIDECIFDYDGNICFYKPESDKKRYDRFCVPIFQYPLKQSAWFKIEHYLNKMKSED